MPRRARMYVAGMPYHVVQRGNNREACFFDVQDYQFYLQLLEELLPRYGVELHAYVLMTNHVHLLMTPEDSESISRLTRVLGSRFAHYVNKQYGRTGTLWEGRHKSSLVDADGYLLKCYRYIEMNPVRAGLVGTPDEYKWSSYCHNAWGENNSIVTSHERYAALAEEKEARLSAYRALFAEILPDTDVLAIRRATYYCQPLGDDRFREQIAAKTGFKPGQMRRGRPKKEV